jgi:uncharacterized protein YndB with AHSA1/START domain
MPAHTTQTIQLTLERVIPAPPGDIFDVWLDQRRPGSPWFGVERAIVQAHVDGLFYHVVPFDGHKWAHYGRFLVIDRPRRIEHTWVSEATRGLESVLTVTLQPQDGQTLLRLTHSNLPADDMGRQHEAGWGFVIDSIAKRFASH